MRWWPSPASISTCCRVSPGAATGTTGGRLNDLAWSRGWPKDKPWVHRYLSGLLGGDAQIAELVLEHQCQRVIFFEDPHVARQHEADIQLLERAVRVVGVRDLRDLAVGGAPLGAGGEKRGA